MRQFARRAATLAAAAAAVAVVHGCSEQLEGGRACPILCPGQDVELRDTIVAAVALDTTLSPYPGLGEEPFLLLTSRGDTLETRVIVRYDTLPTTYRPSGSPTDTPIDFVDSAHLEIRLQFPTPRSEEQTVTVEAYDVDTTAAEGDAADTAAAAMLPLFRPDRFLGTLTFRPVDLAKDPTTAAARDSTARIPIDNGYLLAKIQAKERLRVGLLVRAAESAELVFRGVTQARPPLISFRVSTDQTVPRKTALPYSATPTERFVAAPLSDFVIVARKRPADVPPELLPHLLSVGGVPGRRSYLRFDLPSGIVDSTSVVRATLLLTQYPNRLAARGADTVSLYPQPVAASEHVTDLKHAAALLTPIFQPGLEPIFRLDSLRAPPNDSGDVAIEVIGAVQVWRATQPERASRALVLRIPPTNEGVGQDEFLFFSTEAAEEQLRPRLRIVYVPRVRIGLP
jgi:hypothetical protein